MLVGLLPVLAQRFSPREFDRQHIIGGKDVEVLLEAARWAPSAGNSQPWAFHTARRDEGDWAQLVTHLAGSSRSWATQASVLIVNLAHVHVEDTDWEYSEFSVYDLGQAVAHLTIQAHSMGLSCRQFRAFNKDSLTQHLAVPAHWEVMTMTAIGRASGGADRHAGAATRDAVITWPRPPG
ncbi:nitroreductase family protein [Allobranchiibius sp. CTAmp26]|uniref:nitroreductase family protein n=1 Tax=Allobranchiibius sp. CTAmp26 TaxID=2815214 RepID=UPI001AA147F6|nr:nitroreductase family protein [Allobranchiibius sp. CTAmp26]MBO1756887.1 nitroreductase family protein [Allobranchiibius sp. CTAmp26]